MRIFLVCNRDGYVMDVVSAKTFEEAYNGTIGLNNGELLVEIDKQVFEKIEDFKEDKNKKKQMKKDPCTNRRRTVKRSPSKIIAYIFGDLPAYFVTCKVCGKEVSIGDCPAGHDDICIDCAVDLWEAEEKNRQE
jgi:hypothetical protein